MNSASLPKIFIGTMFSIENQFDDCIKAIKSQKEVTLEHEIITGLGEYDAHVKLYETWEKIKNSYDAFIKVDADMILKDDFVVQRAVKELNYAMIEGYTSIQCPLYDFYIEDIVFGLNCYSPKVIFHAPSSRIYCDRNMSNNKTKVLRKKEDSMFDLFPAGSHCENPNEIQAFMWGYHRGTKSNDAAYQQLKISHSKNPNSAKKLALKGFEVGSSRKSTDMSYSDVEFSKIFETAKLELGL